MRYLQPHIEKDLRKKMVLLGGPRQCGKTTLASAILANAPSGRYFNWDADEDRRAVLAKAWSSEENLIVLDELHKYLKWKNWLKGTFDTQRQTHRFLVTGSARLDVFRRGGDSLLGRYHYWRLHPFSLCEHPASMSKADVPKSNPIRPQDLMATIFHHLGLDPKTQFVNQAGRPVFVLEQGQTIAELI